MLMMILANTPKWVFVLFAVLVWQGVKQMLPRTAGLNRVTIMPLAMTALSLYGVTSAFGESPQALLAWLIGTVVAFAVVFPLLGSQRVHYDAVNRRFQLPGSVVPLALFMGIFFTKYAVGFSVGMQPSLAHDSNFVLAASTVYGTFSGIFLARAAKLWQVALVQSNAAVQAGSPA